MSRNRRCWPSRATPCWRCCSRRRSRANTSSTSRPVWPSTRPPSRRLPVRLTSQKLEQKSDVDSLNLPRLRWRRRSAGDVHVEAPVDGRPAASATRVPLLLFRPGNPHPPKTNQRIFSITFCVAVGRATPRRRRTRRPRCGFHWRRWRRHPRRSRAPFRPSRRRCRSYLIVISSKCRF